VLRPATPAQLEQIKKHLDNLEEGQKNKLQMMDPAMRAAVVQESGSLEKVVSPLGALKLPALLEERRLEYGIPDFCFEAQPAYDRIYVKQISTHKDEKIGNIVMPESAQGRELIETPRGILIAAGLKALDELRSNGINLGDIVHFIELAPFRFVAGTVAGHPVDVLILRSGDILDSFDTKRRIDDGEFHVGYGVNSKGALTHYWENDKGEVLGMPQFPWNPQDF
jgi:hypothetical protein